MTFTTATVTWIMQYKNSNIHTQAYCLHRILTNIPQIHHVCVLCSYWSKSTKNIMSEQDSEWVNNKQLNSIGRPHINIRIVLCFLEYLENGCAITWIHLLIIFGVIGLLRIPQTMINVVYIFNVSHSDQNLCSASKIHPFCCFLILFQSLRPSEIL